MSSELLLHPAGWSQGAVVPRAVRWRDRLAARLRAFRLDAELAAGAEPEARASLTLRAQVLIGPPTRELFARRLRDVVGDAAPSRAWLALQEPTRRREVLELRPELEDLAADLLRPGPVAAGGVAQIRLLLSDGGGPLYARRGDLHAAVDRARRALEL